MCSPVAFALKYVPHHVLKRRNEVVYIFLVVSIFAVVSILLTRAGGSE